MSTINIEQTHNLGAEEARKRVVRMEPELERRYGLSVSWSGTKGAFKGTGVSGTIEVGAERVRIDLKLGLLARPFAGKIRQALTEEVAKHLAS